MIIKRTKFPKELPSIFVKEKNIDLLGIVKSSKKVKAEKQNTIMDYWNELPNVRHHKNKLSGVYKTYVKIINEIMSKGFTDRPWDRSFLHTIKPQFLRGAWPEISVLKSMNIISQMCSPGYWPGPESFLTKSSLPDIIYSSRTQKSWLLYARSLAVPTMERDREMDIFIKRNALETVHEMFIYYNITVSIAFMRDFKKEYEELEEIGNSILFHGGGMVALAERYASWLTSRNVSEVKWLKGKLWDNFKRDAGLNEQQY